MDVDAILSALIKHQAAIRFIRRLPSRCVVWNTVRRELPPSCSLQRIVGVYVKCTRGTYDVSALSARSRQMVEQIHTYMKTDVEWTDELQDRLRCTYNRSSLPAEVEQQQLDTAFRIVRILLRRTDKSMLPNGWTDMKRWSIVYRHLQSYRPYLFTQFIPNVRQLILFVRSRASKRLLPLPDQDLPPLFPELAAL